MRDGVVRKTKGHQKVHACCAGRYGRQRAFSIFGQRQQHVFFFFAGLRLARHTLAKIETVAQEGHGCSTQGGLNFKCPRHAAGSAWAVQPVFREGVGYKGKVGGSGLQGGLREEKEAVV